MWILVHATSNGFGEARCIRVGDGLHYVCHDVGKTEEVYADLRTGKASLHMEAAVVTWPFLSVHLGIRHSAKLLVPDMMHDTGA